jgi:ribonuclease P/MRP protein subunit POP8
MVEDITMADIPSQPTSKSTKSQVLHTSTLPRPSFAYLHLSLLSSSPTPTTQQPDNLQIRSYLTMALRQFLGDTGAGIPVDILKVQGDECWVRVPSGDLGAVSGAITAFPGVSKEGELTLLGVKGAGDWLGALVGRMGEGGIWGP